LSNLPVPTRSVSKAIFYDTRQPGLAFIVTYGGTKSFYLYITYKKQKIIKNIGQFPYMDIENAREKVYLLRKDIENGVNLQSKIITFKDFFYNEYIPKHIQHYKKQSAEKECIKTYKKHLKCLDYKVLSQITKLDIECLHQRIGKQNGKYSANRIIAFVRHVFNISIDWGFLNMSQQIP